jgi:hypothetical protein
MIQERNDSYAIYAIMRIYNIFICYIMGIKFLVKLLKDSYINTSMNNHS